MARKVDDRLVAQSYLKTLNARETAADLGISHQTVFNSLKRSGIKPCRRGNRTASRSLSPEFVKQSYKAKGWVPEEKLGKRDVSTKLGVSAEAYLFSLPAEERITLVRRSITDAVRAHKLQNEED